MKIDDCIHILGLKYIIGKDGKSPTMVFESVIPGFVVEIMEVFLLKKLRNRVIKTSSKEYSEIDILESIELKEVKPRKESVSILEKELSGKPRIK